MADYPCRSYRSNSIKFPKSQPSKVLRFRECYLINLLATKPSSFIRFQEPSLKVIRLSPVKVYITFGEKYGRQPKTLQCLNFKTSSFSRVAISPYISRSVIQDEEFWIIEKSALSRVGLEPRVDNSLGELVSSLILSWSDSKLDSSRIKIVLFKRTILEENKVFFDTQSFIIDWLARTQNNQFPPK